MYSTLKLHESFHKKNLIKFEYTYLNLFGGGIPGDAIATGAVAGGGVSGGVDVTTLSRSNLPATVNSVASLWGTRLRHPYNKK